MRNNIVKKLLLKIEKDFVPLPEKALLNSIEDSLVKVRKSHTESLEAVEKCYGQLVYDCFKYLVGSGEVDSGEINEKGSSSYMYGVTHIDLMLTYIEDFVGADVMEKGVEKILTEK